MFVWNFILLYVNFSSLVHKMQRPTFNRICSVRQREILQSIQTGPLYLVVFVLPVGTVTSQSLWMLWSWNNTLWMDCIPSPSSCACLQASVHVSWKVERERHTPVTLHQPSAPYTRPLVLYNNVGFSKHVIFPGKNYMNSLLWYLMCFSVSFTVVLWFLSHSFTCRALDELLVLCNLERAVIDDLLLGLETIFPRKSGLDNMINCLHLLSLPCVMYWISIILIDNRFSFLSEKVKLIYCITGALTSGYSRSLISFQLREEFNDDCVKTASAETPSFMHDVTRNAECELS